MKLSLPLIGTLGAALILPVAAPHAVDQSSLRYLLTATGTYSGEDALVLGPTGIMTPSANYASFVEQHYLSHPGQLPSGVAPEVAGFTGNPTNVVGFTTPETYDSQSYLNGDADVIHELLTRYNDLLANGSTDPLYLFGYSQSSTILSAVDSHLDNLPWLEYVLAHSTGTSDHAGDVTTYASELATLSAIAPDLRLVLVGDPAAAPPDTADGAHVLPGFDNAAFTQPFLDDGKILNPNSPYNAYGAGTVDGNADANVATGYVGGTGANAPVETDGYAMAGQNTNLDLSPTAVYTIDGDNWAQAFMAGALPSEVSSQHDVYLGADASMFSLEGHVGNVDYFDNNDTFNFWIAAITASITALFGLGVLST